MSTVKITINDNEIDAAEGQSVLEAAQAAEIYIPALCTHPDIPSLKDYPAVDTVFHGNQEYNNDGKGGEEGCRLCLVDIGGEIVRSCTTLVKQGMVIRTETDEIKSLIEKNLIKILEHHPHACLTCAQQEGCNREPCSTNVPVEERCCPKFGNCELQKVSRYIGIPDSTPKWIPTDLPKVENEPIFLRDYNLCIGCARCVRACNDVRGVKALGMVYQNGKAIVGTIAPTLKESECKFCGACVEVCPTGALMDKLTAAQFDKPNNLAPCSAACPVHIDIPRYTRLIAEGRIDDALTVIREKVPFPRVLGRICMHPCEINCRRAELNDPVAICALKRYASDFDKGKWLKESASKKKPSPSGKKVAIVGSGPAGLTAAFYLAKAGHSISIFESQATPGGMLVHTIPLYRLPKEIFDEDLEEIMHAGDIEIRTNQILGKDFSLADLESGGYNATFLAPGLQQSRKIDIPGVDARNVIWGIDFLKQIRAGERVDTGKNILVIGGGNVAVDVARTVKRIGAEKVTMVCLETREEMPAHDWEITAAEEEDIEVQCSWGPMKIIEEDDEVKEVEFKRCTCVFDPAGKFCPEYDESDRTTRDADTVIMAVGQTMDMAAIDDGTVELLSDANMIKVDSNSLRTARKAVWAGGDAVRVPGTIIDAIQMGRTAAGQINKFLGGKKDISEVLIPYIEPSQFIDREENFFDKTRFKHKLLEKENRLGSFDEVEFTYDSDTAVAEARRCLQCDLRLKFKSNPSPPEPWLLINEENVKGVPEVEGVIQLLDDKKEILAIKGAMNMRKELAEKLDSMDNAKFFIFEEDPMYTQRESELLSQYMQKHGKMPGGAEEEDDLF